MTTFSWRPCASLVAMHQAACPTNRPEMASSLLQQWASSTSLSPAAFCCTSYASSGSFRTQRFKLLLSSTGYRYAHQSVHNTEFAAMPFFNVTFCILLFKLCQLSADMPCAAASVVVHARRKLYTSTPVLPHLGSNCCDGVALLCISIGVHACRKCTGTAMQCCLVWAQTVVLLVTLIHKAVLGSLCFA